MEQSLISIDEQERKRLPGGEGETWGRATAEPSLADGSPEADTLRAEIVHVGRKLWERSYVDGNGGNISVRLGDDHLLCTPR
jgi:L-fuculose-phosphate aldolase